MNHPNARLGIPVCGIAALHEGEFAAISRTDHGDLHSPPSFDPVAGVPTPERRL
jgi:hypothetical protein